MRENKVGNLCVKVKLAPQFNDFFPHSVDNLRQAVSTDVWMSIGENLFVGSKVVENAENRRNVAALVGTSVELSIRESSGTAFAKAVVGIFIYIIFSADCSNVLFTL